MNQQLLDRLPLEAKEDKINRQSSLLDKDAISIAFTNAQYLAYHGQSIELLNEAIKADRENMKFIAHCVNNYKGLVQALMQIYEIADMDSQIERVAEFALKGASES